MTNRKTGIYIHVPFCISKCPYCGFYSLEGLTSDMEEMYLQDVIEDLELYGEEYKNCTADTVFIGGGTPSILKNQTIDKILDAIDRKFPIMDKGEITIEANPGTLTVDKLKAYKNIGINRLSMGCQSFDDKMLANLGRIHRTKDIERNFWDARNLGFDNISLDLMFALPGQTLNNWENTLKRAVSLEPEHLSFYSLQIEEGTKFYDLYKNNMLDEPGDIVERRMHHMAMDFLKGEGYDHYEISNAAKTGYRCRHNLKYWSMEEYLGVGPSASSYMDRVRFTEGGFVCPEKRGLKHGALVKSPEIHVNTSFDDASEFVFLGLRKREGISFEDFKKFTGKSFEEVFGDKKEEYTPYIEEGFLIEKDGRLRLSEKGIDISNSIMSVFV